MAPAGVVPALDELEDGHAGLGLGLELPPVKQLALEGREEALDDLAARQDLEAFGGVGSFDDLQGPAAERGEGALELGAAYAPSAKRRRSQGKAFRIEARRPGVPSRSWISGPWPMTGINRPRVSVTM